MQEFDIPLARPWLDESEYKVVHRVLNSGWLVQGPMVEAFEAQVARAAATQYAVAVSSGTAALHLALLALGIGPGDEVVVPTLSFVATASTVRFVGAVPVLADVDPETFNLTARTVEAVLSPRTKAVCVVHQVGLPADLDDLQSLARDRGLLLYEDAACALGATYQGRPVGGHTSLACFSFHPRKVVTTAEGGAVTTGDPVLAERLRGLRQHGRIPEGASAPRRDPFLTRRWVEGYNYRMSDVHAAIGLAQMRKLDEILARRRRIAAAYGELLAHVPGVSPPRVPPDRTHNYQSYTVVLDPALPRTRDQVLAAMRAQGIEAAPGITCIHRNPAYASSVRVCLDAAERVSDHSLLLPLFPGMTDTQVERVVEALRRALGA